MTSLTNDGVDVWKSLPVPRNGFTTQVCRSLRHTFLLARDVCGRYCFEVDLPSSAQQNLNVASFQGVDVLIIGEVSSRPRLLLRLNEKEHWPIFKLLCQELVRVGEQLEKVASLQPVLIRTIERFSEFYRKRAGAFSEIQVRGLIGELLFLQKRVAPVLGWSAALSSWLGPQGAPQDFSFPRGVVEIKTKCQSERDCVTISSLEQLTAEHGDGYMYVYSLRKCSGVESKDSISLRILIEEIRMAIRNEGMMPDVFNVLLSSVCGTENEEDYELYDKRYVLEDEKCYCYTSSPSFPRITRDMVENGVLSAEYKISLSACEPYTREIIFN